MKESKEGVGVGDQALFNKCSEFLFFWWRPESLGNEGRGEKTSSISKNASKSEQLPPDQFAMPMHSTIRTPSSSTSPSKASTSNSNSIFNSNDSKSPSNKSISKSTSSNTMSPPTPKGRNGSHSKSHPNSSSSPNSSGVPLKLTERASSLSEESVNSFRTALLSSASSSRVSNERGNGSVNGNGNGMKSSSSDNPPETPRRWKGTTSGAEGDRAEDSETPRANLGSNPQIMLTSSSSSTSIPGSAVRRERASDRYVGSPRKNRSHSPTKSGSNLLDPSPEKGTGMGSRPTFRDDGSPTKRSSEGGKEAKRRPMRDELKPSTLTTSSLNLVGDGTTQLSNQAQFMGPPQFRPKMRSAGSTPNLDSTSNPSSAARYLRKAKAESSGSESGSGGSRIGSGGALSSVGKSLERKDRGVGSGRDDWISRLPPFVTPARRNPVGLKIDAPSKGSMDFLNGSISRLPPPSPRSAAAAVPPSLTVRRAQRARDASPTKGSRGPEEKAS